MHGDQTVALQRFINEERDAARLVVQQPQRRDGAGSQRQQRRQLLVGSKAQRPRAVRVAKVLQIDALFPLTVMR